MRTLSQRYLSAVAGAFILLAAGPALAQQNNDPKAAEEAAKQQAAEQQKRIEELTQASKQITGPAGNPECVWLGRRVVGLMWRDDLDTAFRHLDLYDRFGCPSGHIQATFRCVVRQGNIDPKSPESLSGRVHACWIEPTMTPTAAAPAANPQSSGTAPK